MSSLFFLVSIHLTFSLIRVKPSFGQFFFVSFSQKEIVLLSRTIFFLRNYNFATVGYDSVCFKNHSAPVRGSLLQVAHHTWFFYKFIFTLYDVQKISFSCKVNVFYFQILLALVILSRVKFLSTFIDKFDRNLFCLCREKIKDIILYKQHWLGCKYQQKYCLCCLK
jgi:hypothetical protein